MLGARPRPAWELRPQRLTQAAIVLLAGRGPPDTQLPLLEAVSHSGPAWPHFQPSPWVPEEHSVGWAASDSSGPEKSHSLLPALKGGGVAERCGSGPSSPRTVSVPASP